MSVDACIRLARMNNGQVRIAESRVMQASFATDEVRAGLLPQLSLEGTWTNNTNSLAGDLTQFQNFNSRKAVGLSAQWVVWDFLVTWRRMKASGLQVAAAVQDKVGVVDALEEQVRAAYVQILQQEQVLGLIRHAIDRLERQVETSGRLYEEGVVKHADVLTLQVQLLEKKQDLIQAQHVLFGHQMTLNQLMGAPLFQVVELAGMEGTPRLFCFDEALQAALSKRPDLLSLRKKQEALSMSLSATKWSVVPTIYAFANSNYAEKSAAVSAGLGLRMPLYEGGRKRAQIQKVRALYCEVSEHIEELSRGIAMEVKTTCLQFEEILQSLQLGREAVALAQVGLQSMQKYYAEGLSSINDVLLAEEQLLAAQRKDVANLYRYFLNYAHLLKITGGFPENQCL